MEIYHYLYTNQIMVILRKLFLKSYLKQALIFGVLFGE